MKQHVSPHMVLSLILGLIAPLSAQNLESTPSASESGLPGSHGAIPRFEDASAAPGSFDVPQVEKAQGRVSDDPAVFASQDARTLDEKAAASRNVESVVDLGVLRKPSPYRKIAVSRRGQPYQIVPDSLQTGLAEVSAAYRESGKHEKSSNCLSIALSVEQRVKLDPSKVLEIVEMEVGANPGCSCEIVKTAITSSEATVDQVVAIVESAIHASPESMRIISQCAIATMPESIAGVQAVLAKLDPNAGETGYSAKSAKSGKDSKVAAIFAPPPANPLDRPPPPIYPPPPVFPPPVTDVNPSVSHR